MQVVPNVLSIRLVGTAPKGVGADSVSWMTSGERTWTSISSTMFEKIQNMYFEWQNARSMDSFPSEISARMIVETSGLAAMMP